MQCNSCNSNLNIDMDNLIAFCPYCGKSTKYEKQIVCPKCGKMVERSKVVKFKYVCYECGGYFRVKTSNRITMVCDKGTFEPWFEGMAVSNPLEFDGYEDNTHIISIEGEKFELYYDEDSEEYEDHELICELPKCSNFKCKKSTEKILSFVENI